MVFSSLLFLFRFLTGSFDSVFSGSERDGAIWCCLLFSLAFYAWGEPVYIILMLVSILVSYTGGILVDRFFAAGALPIEQPAWH